MYGVNYYNVKTIQKTSRLGMVTDTGVDGQCYTNI